MTLLDALKDIRDNGPASETFRDPGGICVAVEDRAGVEAEQRLVSGVMWRWPQHSGNLHFPVPAPESQDPRTYYFYARHRGITWDRGHPYGAARWELLEWCIARIEEEASHEHH